MKKLSLVLFILAFIQFNTFGQGEGKFALDFNFDPAAIFDASAGSIVSMPLIQARMFLPSESAIRLGLDIDFTSNTNYSDADGNAYVKTGSFGLSLIPGYEKHLSADKFVPYIGAQLPIGFGNSSTETKVVNVDAQKVKNGYFNIGLEAVLGFDYYVFRNFYAGVELSPGFAFRKNFDSKTDGNTSQKGGSSVGFHLGSSSGIRIGVRF